MKKSMMIGIVVVLLVIIGVIVYGLVSSNLGSDDRNGEIEDSGVVIDDTIMIGDRDGGIVEVDEEGGEIEGEESNETADDSVNVSDDTGDLIVEMDGSGFTPKNLEINVGDTVMFKNVDSSRRIWPASDVHPNHKTYPGSNIGKCGTAEESQIFDSCSGVDPGESYSFTFNEKGNWRYHDHLSPARKGTIIVK